MSQTAPIIQVFKLDDGFLIQAHGKNIAIRSVKDLGPRVIREAARKPKVQLPQLPQTPAAGAPAVEDLNIVMEREQGNLGNLIMARLTGQITTEQVLTAAAQYCPHISTEDVMARLTQAETAWFQQQQDEKPPEQWKGLSAKCACPMCEQNTSYPNERGWCVACYQGEHLHPMPGRMKPVNYTPPLAETPQVVVVSEQEDDDDEDESPGTERVDGAGEAASRPDVREDATEPAATS